MNILLFSTIGFSLVKWSELGILERELGLLSDISKTTNTRFYLVTYGDSEDFSFAKGYTGITTIPLYSYLPFKLFPRLYAIEFFVFPFLIPFLIASLGISFFYVRTNQMWGAFAPILTSTLFRKPLLLRIGYEALFFARQSENLTIQLLSYLQGQLGYLTARKIQVATRADKSFILANYFCISPEKIVVRPNHVSHFFVKQNYPGRSVSPNTKRDLICIGRHVHQKNYKALLLALSNHSKLYTLTIIGDGPLYDETKRLAAKLQINLNMIKSLPQELIPSILNQHSLFILPSLYEGNPKVLIESLTYGIPCIATHTYGCEDLIEHGVTGLLVQPDMSDLCESIDTLLTDTSLMRSLSINARHKYVTTHGSITLLEQDRIIHDHMVKKC